MRRAAALAFIPLLAVVTVAGCGSSSSSKPAASASADTYKSVTVSGTFNKTPTVTIPKETGSGQLLTKTLIQGTGATLKLDSTDAVFGNYVAYDWSGATNKLLGSSYTAGAPSVFYGQLLPGLEKALTGQKFGSRVLAVIPPAQGFGTSGNSNAGIGAKDTLVFVIDLISEFPANLSAKQASSGGGALPTVTPAAANSTTGATIKIPAKVTPPKTLVAKDLIKGTGAVVKKGQAIAVQYTGVIWRTGQLFDSSYSRESPSAFPIGENKVIKGWDNSLVGQTVGSRVLLVVPPVDGYGAAGNSTGSVAIKGTDTLVFVVDILSAVTD